MRIDVLTLFPEMFPGPLGYSITGRAFAQGLAELRLVNLRDFTDDRHRTADDAPYGGGAGMVMKPEPVFRALEALRAEPGPLHAVLLSPQGRRFTQAVARELAARPRLALVCGHYEGVDERIRIAAVDEEVSIGDYVLTGGEVAAMVVIDAVVRLLPGALGAEASLEEESFTGGLLEYPHYTRPAEFAGLEVPEVLRSGNHAAIRAWRRREALRRTLERRPDLLATAPLDDEDRRYLAELGWRPHPHPGCGRGTTR